MSNMMKTVNNKTKYLKKFLSDFKKENKYDFKINDYLCNIIYNHDYTKIIVVMIDRVTLKIIYEKNYNVK